MNVAMPARKECCALEIEIERAWCALVSSRRQRVVYLSPDNRLFWGNPIDDPEGDQVGTYGTSISLHDFREDVFFVHQNRRQG